MKRISRRGMWLIFILLLSHGQYLYLGKSGGIYMHPVYFMGLRMIIAGGLLLGYLYWFKKEHWRSIASNHWEFGQIIIFHIYCAYVFEFWALQYLTSAKTCLLYNLSPFITALLTYLLFNQKLSMQKWIGLAIGFAAMLPILVAPSSQEDQFISWGFISLPELALLFAVASAAYGWIIMKDLVVHKGYNPMMVNGIGMAGGGFVALLTAFIFEGFSPFLWPDHTVPAGSGMPLGAILVNYSPFLGGLWFRMSGFNIIANIIRIQSLRLFIAPIFANIALF